MLFVHYTWSVSASGEWEESYWCWCFWGQSHLLKIDFWFPNNNFSCICCSFIIFCGWDQGHRFFKKLFGFHSMTSCVKSSCPFLCSWILIFQIWRKVLSSSLRHEKLQAYLATLCELIQYNSVSRVLRSY